jgi:hypothetical protein
VIAEFEQRLATVLGPRLTGAFKNRVEVAPATVEPPRIVVGVTRAEPLEPDFGSRRREPVQPRSDDTRRVVRLLCSVELDVQPSAGGGRAEERAGIDDALFALDDGDFRDGTALDAAGDTGFVIQELRLAETTSPLADGAGAIALSGSGWFWPVGVPPQTGTRIGVIHLREAALPVELVPATPVLLAGGGPIDFTVRVATSPLIRIQRGPPLPALPFGQVALRVGDDQGGPGAGALAGGADGGDGVRLVDLVDDAATITYTPPAQAAVDYLLVELDSRDDGRRVRVGRVPLAVRAG